MSGTYQTTGIILHNNHFKEDDLLVTLLSPEYGLIRAIAPSAKKYKSRLRGRIQSFVINNFLLVKGSNLDRIIQIETLESYPKLSQNIGKLTAGQYLLELVLNLAVSEQPQTEFYSLLTEHLSRIEQLLPNVSLFPNLAQAVFHFLIIAGIAPEINYCLRSGERLIANFDSPNWQVGFSFIGGGLINLHNLKNVNNLPHKNQINAKFNAIELLFLQSLLDKSIGEEIKFINQNYSQSLIDNSWLRIERNLKDYSEFHLGKKLKSAEMLTDILIDF
jgi:DNA repair protein RecO (recombination protein O)